jgi:hypothetical protein
MPTSRPQSAGNAPIDPARIQLVDAARTAWIGRLIDLSRRNNLLFYRPMPSSSIDLPKESPDPNARPGRVLAIARKAQENREEKGLETLYLARHLLCPCFGPPNSPGVRLRSSRLTSWLL